MNYGYGPGFGGGFGAFGVLFAIAFILIPGMVVFSALNVHNNKRLLPGEQSFSISLSAKNR